MTQSSFNDPCTLLNNATTGATGFNSGPVPVKAGASATAPSWTLEITEPTPLWFFCATSASRYVVQNLTADFSFFYRSTHCQSGAVKAI